MRSGMLFFLGLALLIGGIVTGGDTPQAKAATTKPTVYLCGDSTVMTYAARYYPQAGWGQYIANYFTSDVAFVNKAIGGRSSKSFYDEGRLTAILNVIQANDYLLIQFGHNDANSSKANLYTSPYSTYKQYLKKYISGARQRGAIPVLITPVGRLNYVKGVFKNDFPDYCTAMKQLGVAENVPVIDLMSRSLAYYTSIGYSQTYSLFLVSSNGTDYTHFTQKGATEIARLVAKEVSVLGIPLAKYLK